MSMSLLYETERHPCEMLDIIFTFWTFAVYYVAGFKVAGAHQFIWIECSQSHIVAIACALL